MDTKVCSKCGFPKPVDDFSPQAQCKGGRRGTCKSCASIFSSDWQVVKKKSLPGRMKTLLSSAKARAKTNGISFNLDLAYLVSLYEVQRAFVP